MRLGTVFIFFRKELTDFLRDRRTVISLMVVPLALMPAASLGTGYFIARSQRIAKDKTYTIALKQSAAVNGLEQALTGAGFLTEASTNPRAAVESKSREIGVEVTSGKSAPAISIFNDASQMEMQVVRGRIRQALDTLRDNQVKTELQRAGVSTGVLTPFTIENVNTAPPRKMGGAILGMFLGYLIVILMVSAGMYPAIDMTAGEKERRTLEMLLSAAARREELVAGKVLATMTATGVSAILSLASFAVTFYVGRRAGGEMFSRMGDLPLDVPTFLLIAVSLLPMIVFTAAVSMAVATPARSTKEAMSYMTPVVMVSVFLGIFSTLPGVDLGSRAALIPVANFCWMLKQLLQGEWSWTAFAMTMAANCVYAGIAFYAVLRRFRDEKILFRA